MGQVSLRINGYVHALACADGEEAHLKAMGADIDARIAGLRQQGLAGGEARMLVVAALQLADELADARKALAAAPEPPPPQAATLDPKLAETVRAMADRIGVLAETLQDAATSPLETVDPSA